MRGWTTAVGALVAGALGLGVARGDAAADLLQNLHQTQAPGARWSVFATHSNIRKRIHTVSTNSPLYGTSDSTEIRIEEIREIADGQVTTELLSGDRSDDIGPMVYALDVPFFAAEKAVRLADDSVQVGDRLYPAQVYQFERILPVPAVNETERYRFIFWLSPKVPGGVLRRVTDSECEDPFFGGHDEERLTELDVPLVVNGHRLHCYRIDTESRNNDGTTEFAQGWFNDAVPGKIVKQEVRDLTKGSETLRQESAVIDFHVEKP